MKHALIITTISGFVPQFEMNDVRILQENGYTVHYASDFENPIYNIDQTQLKRDGLILHHIDIRKSPFQITKNTKAFLQLNLTFAPHTAIPAAQISTIIGKTGVVSPV
jgi:hypothetical protein